MDFEQPLIGQSIAATCISYLIQRKGCTKKNSRKFWRFIYHKSQVIQTEKQILCKDVVQKEKKYCSFKFYSSKVAKKSCEGNFTQVAQSFAQCATLSLRDTSWVYSNVFWSCFCNLLNMMFCVKTFVFGSSQQEVK